MKNLFLNMAFLFAMLNSSCAQKPTTGDPAFDAKLNELLAQTVPTISTVELSKKQGSIIILDARELAEYNVSHIPGAKHVGFENFDPAILNTIKKDEPIVLYCSIGYRSEKIGERLKEMGYANVQNLYGSIFDWANKGMPLESSSGKETLEIHTYNEEWSQWVKNPAIKKVW